MKGEGVKVSDANRFFHQLVESLQLLSADYSTQVGTLPKFVVVPDEIALTFHESVLLLDQISHEGFLTDEAVRRLVEIDDKFNEMSEEGDFWSLESLQHHPEWNNIRIMAKEILRSLGVPPAKPDLDWITFVGGDVSSIEDLEE
jgi:hypothetical protein